MLSGRGTRRLVAVGGGLCLVATVLAALALASAGAAVAMGPESTGVPVAMGPESTGVPAATDSESTGAAADRHPQRARRVGPRIPAAMSASKAGGEITSWARPQDDLVHRIAEDRAGPGASAAEIDAEAEAFLAEWSATHYHGPDPTAHDALRYREDTLLEEGVTTQEAVSGTMRLLVIAVEFAGSDSVVDFSHEKGIRTGKCITETTTYTGPLHGQIPPPGPRDNNTYWAPNFDADFFTRMIFSTAGITERLRPELIDPEDGRAGIDISGLTMENFYQEVSGGRLGFDSGPRGPVAWVQVPHSVAYYSANACKNGRVAGRGLPANPNGESQLYTDLVAAVNSTYPDFPWADYDTDGDGILDHVELIHAGLDESGGGGVDGTNQIWAHRGSVGGGRGITVDDRGTPDDPDDDIRMRGYTIQPENLELGVLVHEFGHDLGLLDLYSTTGEESVIWWDLMSTGSNTGRLLGTDPTHMSAHTKWVLGWRDLEDISPNEDPVDYLLGQAAEPPEGTRPALKIDLPPSEISYTIPPGDSTQMWWSGADQNWADLTLGREVDLAGVTGPITFSFDTDYVIESDWDYMFVEASADGGQTYTQLKGYRVGTDEELTTPDNYPDPNGRLADYGGLKHGYTGDSRGWVRVYHDLTAYAGQQIHLRLRHATDAGFLERGAFLDNFRLQAGDTVVLDDPVEDDDTHGWTTLAGSFRGGAPGKGWRLSDGTDRFPRYYVLEWRNAVGFDTGLKYAYNTVHSGLTENNRTDWRVDKVPSNTPGLLVWLRDTRFEYAPERPNNYTLTNAMFRSQPSEGPKGGLLVVDAHAEPLRGPRDGKFENEYGSWAFPPKDNWRGRIQVTNAAFGLVPTGDFTLTVATGAKLPETTILTPTHYAPMPGVPAFHDSFGYFPGVEALPEPITTYSDTERLRVKPYAFVDPDASTVVPAAGYYPPRTPAGFTGQGAETSPPSADVSTCETFYLRGSTPTCVSLGAIDEQEVAGAHSGNPGDSGVQLGYHFQVMRQADDGSAGLVRVWRQREAAAAAAGMAAFDDATLAASAGLRNVGGAYTMTLYSDFDDTAATYVAGSATEGAVPVTATAARVAAAVAAGGPGALADLEVPPEDATGVAWAGFVATGKAAAFAYRLTPARPSGRVRATTLVYGPPGSGPLARGWAHFTLRPSLYLPVAKNGK